jgi:hypothetical protein
VRPSGRPPCLQLKPGYDGVPKLLAAFEKGIPHKVEADKQGTLVSFGYTEVGERIASIGCRLDLSTLSMGLHPVRHHTQIFHYCSSSIVIIRVPCPSL